MIDRGSPFSNTLILLILGLVVGVCGGYLISTSVLQPKLKEYSLQNRELNHTITELQADNLYYEQQIVTLQNQTISLESQLHNLEANLSSLESDLYVAQIQVSTYEKSVHSLKEEIEWLEVRVKWALGFSKHDLASFLVEQYSTIDHTAWGRKGDLELSMTVDNTEISVGEEINCVFTLQNKGNDNISYTLPDTQRFDLFLYDSDGIIVTSWSNCRGFAAVLVPITIGPGKNISYSIPWNLYTIDCNTASSILIPTGQYSISGIACSETPIGRIETLRIKIEVKE